MTGTFRIGLVESAGFCVVAGTLGATVSQDAFWGVYCGAAMGVCLSGRAVVRRAGRVIVARLRHGQTRLGRV